MKFKYLLLCIMTIVALAGVLTITTPTHGSEKEKAVGSSAADGYVYTVKEYGGMVAVFGYGSNEPLQILDCPLNSLPEEEVALLKAGINVEGDEQLQNVIEAYD